MINVDFVTFRSGRPVKIFRNNRHLLPLFEFRCSLLDRGIHVRFFTLDDLTIGNDGNILCLDSRIFEYQVGQLTPSSIRLIEKLRNAYDKILWFDNRDSSGTTQFEVLPLVDKYCKKQYLRDKEHYFRPYNCGRVFSEFYRHRYGVGQNDDPIPYTPLEPNYLHKLCLSWNLAYSNFQAGSKILRYVKSLFASRTPRFYPPGETRDINLQARYSTHYNLDSVAFQRQVLLEYVETLDDLDVRTGRIPRTQYYEEMKRTIAVLSPFGWGEICYRDFEALVYGSALIKPSISHLETWPDIFCEGETYVPLPWDIEEAKVQLNEILRNRHLLKEVAIKGQNTYRQIWGHLGALAFVNHFESLILN